MSKQVLISIFRHRQPTSLVCEFKEYFPPPKNSRPMAMCRDMWCPYLPNKRSTQWTFKKRGFQFTRRQKCLRTLSWRPWNEVRVTHAGQSSPLARPTGWRWINPQGEAAMSEIRPTVFRTEKAKSLTMIIDRAVASTPMHRPSVDCLGRRAFELDFLKTTIKRYRSEKRLNCSLQLYSVLRTCRSWIHAESESQRREPHDGLFRRTWVQEPCNHPRQC